MIVGIYDYKDGDFPLYLQRYETILDFNGIENIRLNVNNPDFWSKVEKLDLFIYHWIGTYNHHQLAPILLHIVEDVLKVKCFPNSVTCWHYDDKVRESYLLERYKFPIVPSWTFWDKKSATDWLQNAEFPLVFKLKGGASSVNVVLVKDKRYAKRLVNEMFGKGIISGFVPGTFSLRVKDEGFFQMSKRLIRKILEDTGLKDKSPLEIVHRNYIYFQKFLPSNNFDTRVTIIGKRAFGARRYNRKGDFRASGSGLADFHHNDIDNQCIKIAFKISKKLNFQTMSYDFLYDENNQPLVSEISYTSPDWSVFSSPGYWDENLEFHEGRLWPQYCILSDLLKLPSLKQPEMKI